MAKAKRNRSAHNKIAGSLEGGLVQAEPTTEPAIVAPQPGAVIVARPTLFTAEFEKVIEIIARDRVYREMLARFGSRLLMSPHATDEAAST
jgi:hypothetical protein